MLEGIHHVAIICSDYNRSRAFYTQVLGFDVLAEVYRVSRNSWKLDLGLNGKYLLELFSFPSPPARVSKPEATGLRHLAFSVKDLDETLKLLHEKSVPHEPVRTDEYTGFRFTFISDPDGLPIELYESVPDGN